MKMTIGRCIELIISLLLGLISYYPVFISILIFCTDWRKLVLAIIYPLMGIIFGPILLLSICLLLHTLYRARSDIANECN